MGLFDDITDRVEGFLDEVFVPEEVRRLLQRATKLIERGNYDQALGYLKRAQSERPGFHRTEHLLGRCHFGREDYGAALEAFESALEERDEAIGHFYAGLAAEQLGRWRQARDHFHRVLASAEHLPYEFDVHFALGRVYRQINRLDRAARELQKARRVALEESESSGSGGRDDGDAGQRRRQALVDVTTALGEVLLDLGDTAGVRTLLEEADLPADHRQGLLLQARADEAEEHHERAAEQYRRVLEMAPGDVDAMLGAARAHLEVNATAQARELLLRALERTEPAAREDGEPPLDKTRRAEVLTLLGRTHERAGNQKQGLEHYEGAVRLLSDRRDQAPRLAILADLGAGRLAARLGHWEQAAQHFDRAGVDAEGESKRDALLGLARCRLHERDVAAARRLLAEAADEIRELPSPERAGKAGDDKTSDGKTADGKAELQHLRGRASLEGGDSAEALIAFQEALHLARRPALRQEIETDRRAALERLEPDWHLPERIDGPLAADQALEQLADVLRDVPHAYLDDYLDEVRALGDTLSEPLSVAVLGEFNAGKSTLVNALVGEEVAPMGVLPTTAHTCFIRYGPRKTARVVYKPGRAPSEADERDESDEVPTPALDDAEIIVETNYDDARRRMEEHTDAIERLEFLYPHPQLRAVEFCDTPGFNALEEEHESIARQALDQAEAILWVLDANQALSQTEFELLESIPDSSERVVVLLNKVDRLGQGEERREAAEELVEYVEQHIGPRVAGCFAISGQEALEARCSPDNEAPEAFLAFEEMLDSRLTQRAGHIKTLEIRRELSALVERLNAEVADWLREHEARLERADALTEWVADMADSHPEAAAKRQAEAIGDQFSFVARTVAREIRDSLRPRGSILSRMSLAEEDREFVLEMFSDRLGEVLERSHREVRSEVDDLETDIARRVGQLLEGLSLAESRVLDRRLEGLFDETRVLSLLLEERVYGELAARADGRIEAAGPARIEELESTPDASLEAWQTKLDELLPDAPAHIDAALGDWYREFFMAVRRFCERARRDLQLVRLEIDHRLQLSPLTDLLGSL